jgi:hypothetical protein
MARPRPPEYGEAGKVHGEILMNKFDFSASLAATEKHL